MSDKTLSIPAKPRVEEPTKRIEEVRTERRRRTDVTYENAHRLSVDHSKLDHENFAYRFVHDVGSRIHDFTVRDDWDKVPDPDAKPDADGGGTPIRKSVGTQKDGSPLYDYLLRKPKQYFEEDAKKKRKALDDMDAQIKRGQHTAAPAAGADQSNTYTPEGSISLQAKTSREPYKP